MLIANIPRCFRIAGSNFEEGSVGSSLTRKQHFKWDIHWICNSTKNLANSTFRFLSLNTNTQMKWKCKQTLKQRLPSRASKIVTIQIFNYSEGFNLKQGLQTLSWCTLKCIMMLMMCLTNSWHLRKLIKRTFAVVVWNLRVAIGLI